MVKRELVLEASAEHPQPGQAFQYGTAGVSTLDDKYEVLLC